MLKARGHCIAYFLPRQEKKNVKFNNMMPNLFNYKTGISTKCQLWFVPILYLVPTPKVYTMPRPNVEILLKNDEYIDFLTSHQGLFSSHKYWLDRRCGQSTIEGRDDFHCSTNEKFLSFKCVQGHLSTYARK